MALRLAMAWSGGNTEHSIHGVQHTPGTAYTEYSIHRVRYTPSTAYTEYSMHWVLHTARTCIIRRSTVFPLPASLSYLGIPCCTQCSTFPPLWVNQWIESQLQSRLPAELLPRCTLPISFNHGLQVHSKLARLQTPSVSLKSHDYCLQVHTITASKCLSKLARSQPPSVSPNSLDYGLQVRTIMASKCIYKLAQSQPPYVGPNSLDHSIGVHLYVHWITVWLNGGGSPSSTLRCTSHGIRSDNWWETAVLAWGA